MTYIGSNRWFNLIGEAPYHIHPCPECYDDEHCFDKGCTLEPDMEQTDGIPSGSHLVCSDCNPVEMIEKPEPIWENPNQLRLFPE